MDKYKDMQIRYIYIYIIRKIEFTFFTPRIASSEEEKILIAKH